MDQKAKYIYQLFSDTQEDIRNSIMDSLQYNVDKKEFIVGSTTIKLADKPYAILGFGKSSSFVIDKICSILPINNRIFATCMCQDKTVISYKIVYSEHPIPNENNFIETKQIVDQLKLLPRDSILIIIKSGGGSSMFSLPEDEIGFEDKIFLNEYLLESGLHCREVNEIRKVISKVKGGKLLKCINASSIVNIIISDDVLTMNTPNLSSKFVASGPAIPQTIDGHSVYLTLLKSVVWNKISKSAQKYLESCNHPKLENNKQSFQEVQTQVLINNRSFINCFVQKLKRISENVITRHEPLFENVNNAVNNLLNEFLLNSRYQDKLIYVTGGEVTCSPNKNSMGGRCQHFVSLLIPLVSKLESVYCFALATDGEDYLKNVGGAYISNSTLNICNENKLEFKGLIESWNSNILLSSVNCLFESTPKNINLGDIYIICRL